MTSCETCNEDVLVPFINIHGMYCEKCWLKEPITDLAFPDKQANLSNIPSLDGTSISEWVELTPEQHAMANRVRREVERRERASQLQVKARIFKELKLSLNVEQIREIADILREENYLTY